MQAVQREMASDLPEHILTIMAAEVFRYDGLYAKLQRHKKGYRDDVLPVDVQEKLKFMSTTKFDMFSLFFHFKI